MRLTLLLAQVHGAVSADISELRHILKVQW